MLPMPLFSRTPKEIATAVIGLCERTWNRSWLDVGGGLTVARSFDARTGTRLTPTGVYRAGSEPGASDGIPGELSMPGSVQEIGRALVVLSLVFACSALIRRWSSPLRKLFIPTAVIGGFLVLGLG